MWNDFIYSFVEKRHIRESNDVPKRVRPSSRGGASNARDLLGKNRQNRLMTARTDDDQVNKEPHASCADLGKGHETDMKGTSTSGAAAWYLGFPTFIFLPIKPSHSRQ